MTHTKIENVLWYAVSKCLGLDPNNETAYVQQRVRISWNEATDWPRDENVAFLRVADGDPGIDDISQYRETHYEYDAESDKEKEIITYHKAHMIHILCYGPDAYTDAMTIKIGLVRTDMRAYLQKNKLGIMPHIRAPQRMTELDDAGDWWERWDLFVYCYESVTHEFTYDFIEHAPNIITMGE